jgi:hypothetical protein
MADSLADSLAESPMESSAFGKAGARGAGGGEVIDAL